MQLLYIWFKVQSTLFGACVQADGREVNLGLIYPCFLGARMLGSTIFPWLTSGHLSIRTEDCLVYAYIILGLILSIIAYDYQVQLIHIFFKHTIHLSGCNNENLESSLNFFYMCRKLVFWLHCLFCFMLVLGSFYHHSPD